MAASSLNSRLARGWGVTPGGFISLISTSSKPSTQSPVDLGSTKTGSCAQESRAPQNGAVSPERPPGVRCGHAFQSRRESHLMAGGLPGPGPQVGMVLEGSALGLSSSPACKGSAPSFIVASVGGVHPSALTLIHLQARLLLGGGRWRRKATEPVCGDQTSSLCWRPMRGARGLGWGCSQSV